MREGLGIYISPTAWDPERKRVRGRSPEARLINNRLEHAINKTQEILWHYQLLEKPLTLESFREEFHNTASREDFLPWMREEIERQYARRIIGKYTRWDHLHILERLERFAVSVPFASISRQWLERFDAWHQKLLTAEGHEGSRARERALKCIRKYLRAAQEQGKDFQDPFAGFRWPKWKSSPTWLEEPELRHLLQLWRDPLQLEIQMAAYARRHHFREFDVERWLDQDNQKHMRERLRSFLVQCFVGLRYSDLRRLSWEQHSQGQELIRFSPLKTQGTSGKTATIPITPVIWELLTAGTGERGRGHVLLVPSNQKYNKGLKIVADVAGIGKTLTSHVGRHTFGARMVAGGVSVVSLMEMMGITKMDTALIYIHSSLEQQARELQRAQEGF